MHGLQEVWLLRQQGSRLCRIGHPLTADDWNAQDCCGNVIFWGGDRISDEMRDLLRQCGADLDA
eukprot:5015060-Pleurochrysis_carterae.AAC.7